MHTVRMVTNDVRYILILMVLSPAAVSLDAGMARAECKPHECVDFELPEDLGGVERLLVEGNPRLTNWIAPQVSNNGFYVMPLLLMPQNDGAAAAPQAGRLDLKRASGNTEAYLNFNSDRQCIAVYCECTRTLTPREFNCRIEGPVGARARIWVRAADIATEKVVPWFKKPEGMESAGWHGIEISTTDTTYPISQEMSGSIVYFAFEQLQHNVYIDNIKLDHE